MGQRTREGPCSEPTTSSPTWSLFPESSLVYGRGTSHSSASSHLLRVKYGLIKPSQNAAANTPTGITMASQPDRPSHGMGEWVFFISSDASCISIIFHNKKGKKHLKINKKKKKNNNNSPDNTPYSSDGCSRFGTPGSPVSVLLQAHSGSFIHSFIYSVFI